MGDERAFVGARVHGARGRNALDAAVLAKAAPRDDTPTAASTSPARPDAARRRRVAIARVLRARRVMARSDARKRRRSDVEDSTTEQSSRAPARVVAAMGNLGGKPAPPREDEVASTSGQAAPSASGNDASGATGDAAVRGGGGGLIRRRGPVPGLRLVEGVVSASEHDALVAWVRNTLRDGRDGKLPGNTYAPIPDKWRKRNQSREMLQFGTYTHSNRVEAHVPVAPMPSKLCELVDVLVNRGVVAESERPDACTINVYQPGQWIPPHIDNPAFARPFVTVSLLSEQVMTLGRGMIWREGCDVSDADNREGEEATFSLPVGSAVVVCGDAADVYEHAVPPVTEERISLTFRRAAGEDEEDDTRARTESTERYRKEYRDKRKAAKEAEDIAAGRAKGDDPDVEGEPGATKDAPSNAPAAPAVLSKNQQKKDARKAARAAAKARAREEKEKEKVTAKEKTLVASVDGTTFEKKEKKRSCPPCPRELLPSSQEETAADAQTEPTAAAASALPSVEREHVMNVYDAVARQWHGTRYRAWSGVEDFIARSVRPGTLVVDVGCGNGKNMPEVEARGGFVAGCDFSVGLLNICAERGLEVFAADAVCLPLRSSAFDVALNIAVLHHVSSPARRVKLISETMRLLRVGGVALFYAWALEQEVGGVSGHHFESQDVLVPFHKRAVAGDERGDDDAAEGSDGGKVYQRYCHVYKEGELPELFAHLSSWVRVTATYFDCGNWCVEAERIA